MPRSVRIAPHVRRIVNRFILALNLEAVIRCLQVKIRRSVVQAYAIVEPSRTFLAQNKILRSFFLSNISHGHVDLLTISRAPSELLLPRERVAKPDLRHDIRRSLLV